MDADIEGVIIPDNPRLRELVDDDHAFEAIGMERLYTAIVHMETRPRYLSHLFHTLGKAITESDVGGSHPKIWPISSPPLVNAQYVCNSGVEKC
jgi:hypothetical protein